MQLLAVSMQLLLMSISVKYMDDNINITTLLGHEICNKNFHCEK